MKINFLKNWSLFSLLFVFAILITSCTKEDIEEPAQQVDPQIVQDVVNRNDIGAFDPILGFEDCDCFGPLGDIDWENGDPEVINAEVEAYLASLTEEEIEALFTPVCTETEFYPNACFAECQGVTDYSDCDDFGWGCDGEDFEVIQCYDLVYPVTGVFSDGTTVTFESAEDYYNAVITANEEPQLVYPFNVQTINENGTIETYIVENENDWIELGVDCFGWSGHDTGAGGGIQNECFRQEYPLTLVVEGENLVFENEAELEVFFISLLENGEVPEELNFELGYPIYLINLETGENYTAETEEEYFNLILEHCD